MAGKVRQVYLTVSVASDPGEPVFSSGMSGPILALRAKMNEVRLCQTARLRRSPWFSMH